MPRSAYLTIPIAVVLAALRLMGHKDQAFQAAAHLFVGGLFVAWFLGRPPAQARWNLAIAVVLSVIELAAFLFSRH